MPASMPQRIIVLADGGHAQVDPMVSVSRTSAGSASAFLTEN
jgi:hypothetical protein